MKPDYQKLLQRVETLEKWKAQKERQQISYPLDVQSQSILNKYFLSATGNIWDASETGEVFKRLIITQDGVTNVTFVFTSLIRYTAVPSTNRLTLGPDIVNRTQGRLVDGDVVYLQSGEGTIQTTPGTNTSSPPAPLLLGTAYFVVNATGDGTSVQLEASPGGGAIDITTTGTGQQFIYAVIP
jgi:hypothetical protein